MACLTLFAEATHRTYDALRALAVTLIAVLLWNPFLLAYDSGFQMSIVVTPALILAVPILEAKLLWVKSGVLREIISVSIVAQLACLPLILWQTGELGVWAIPANMFVMSFVPVAMVSTFFAGVIGVGIPMLAPVAGLPAFCILYYILAVAQFSSNLPFSDIIIPPIPFLAVIAMYGIFVFVLYLLTRLRSKSASQ
jgi:competence protein ComEC